MTADAFGDNVENIVARLVQRVLLSKSVAEQVFDASPFMSRYFGAKKVKPGEDWEIPFQAGKRTGTWFSVDAVTDTTGTITEPNEVRMLEFTSRLYATFVRLNMIKMSRVKGEAELLDYVSTQLDSVINSARDEIAEVIWSGDGVLEPTGLSALVNDVGPFGGFANRADAGLNGSLASQVFDATDVVAFPTGDYGPAGTFTLQKAHKVFVSVKQETSPDMIVQGADVYEDFLRELLNFNQIIGTSGKAGVEGEVAFNGAELILERRVPDGEQYYLNMKHVYPCFQTDYDEFTLPEGSLQRDVGNNTQIRTLVGDMVLGFENVSDAPNRLARMFAIA